MNPELCSAAAAPTPQPLPRPGPGDAPGELCLCWALSRGVRAQLGSGTALLAAKPEPGPAPGSLGWVYPPDSPRGYRQQLQPTANCTHITGCHLGTAGRTQEPFGQQVQQLCCDNSPIADPAGPASHLVSGPGWPWGSLSLWGTPIDLRNIPALPAASQRALPCCPG